MLQNLNTNWYIIWNVVASKLKNDFQVKIKSYLAVNINIKNREGEELIWKLY